MTVETPDTARVIEESDEMWGRRTIDVDDLLDKLGTATHAVYEASQAAMWRTEQGYPIHSHWALLLGGLSQAIDAVIDQLEDTPCCPLHKAVGCCDPDDCGPCCENCPTCPALAQRARKVRTGFDGCGCPIFEGENEDFPRGEWTEHVAGCRQLAAWLSDDPRGGINRP